MHDEEIHLPPPTLWPLGFAIGIAVVLVGLIVNPLLISTIGAVIAIVFAILWARDATSEYRGRPVVVGPERRELVEAGTGETGPPANEGGDAMPHPEPGERFPRSKFLEGSTLGLGAVIGGLVTVPALGFMVVPPFRKQGYPKVDLGPVANFPEGKWFVTKFFMHPDLGEVSHRTAYMFTKAHKVFLHFEVCEGEYQGTRLFRPYRVKRIVTLGPRGRFVLAAGGDLYRMLADVLIG